MSAIALCSRGHAKRAALNDAQREAVSARSILDPKLDGVQPRWSAAVGAMLRLSLLMLAPRAGRPLRSRLYGMFRREGWRGFARRLPRPRIAGQNGRPAAWRDRDPARVRC